MVGTLDKMERWENGDLDEPGTQELFQELVFSQVAWCLDAQYQQKARDLLTSSPRLKPGDSLNWGLMSQTDDEDIPSRIHVSVVFRPAGTTRPSPYPQAT